MKKLLLLVIIALLPGFITAQESYLPKKDSLLQVISNQTGKEKLKTYRQLTLLLLTHEEQTDTVIKYYRMAETEATKQNDLQFVAQFKCDPLNFYYNQGLYDKFFEEAGPIIDFLKKSKNWNMYFQVSQTVLEAYGETNQYQKALKGAEALYKEAQALNDKTGLSTSLYVIGYVYRKWRRYDEAADYFKQCIDLESSREKPSLNWLYAYMYLNQVYVTQERWEDLRVSLKAYESAILQYEKQNNVYFPSTRSEAYKSYVKLYLSTGELEKAEEYCDKMLAINNTLLTRADVYNNRGLIEEKRGNDQKALDWFEKALDISKRTEEGSEFYNGILLDKAHVLLNLNRNSEVFPLIDTVLQNRDSTYIAEFHAQLDEFRTQYEVDKHIAEKEKQHAYFIFALIGCVILAVLLGIWIYYSRLVARKNRSLYLQIQELTRIEKKAEENLLSIPEEELSREMQLFRELSILMQSEKLFTDPELNRKTLADRIHTNESYLADAIRDASGETFSSYIANLRLQYALELLDEHPEMTFDSIAVDSGHGSYSSFFRTFTKKYNITPSEYRKMSESKIKN